MLQDYAAVRARSLTLASPLSAEDQAAQSMPDASPTKWHLAHTTWFFETLVLGAKPGYRPFDPRWAVLFNSYYESLGPRHPRPQRGLLTRPSLDEVLDYRAHVDVALRDWLPRTDESVHALVELGLHHEQQHQELLLTDAKHLLSCNPLQPAYADAASRPAAEPGTPLQWLSFAGGRTDVGHAGAGFAFDNESPRHPVWLAPYELANRPVTCGEYLEFMRDGGYRDPRWWLSDGWATVQAQGWTAPLYWRDDQVFTLYGLQPLRPDEPVAHLSFYEASAYAAWAGARLPTEFEWEAARAQAGGVLAHWPDVLQPQAAHAGRGLLGLHEVWEWTRSAYDPYPGFRPLGTDGEQPAALAEYNGKFMVGTLVLRGASCATPPGHARATYRNFFAPSARWQFSGLRLARDAR